MAIKPNGMKARRYRFGMRDSDVAKESILAIGDYAIAPSGETLEKGQARRDGRRFTLTEARALVKQEMNPAHNRKLQRIKCKQESATTLEAVANQWLVLKDWEEITKKRRLDMLTRVVSPKIGSLPVKSITPAHILDVLNTSARSSWYRRPGESACLLVGTGKRGHAPEKIEDAQNEAEHIDRVTLYRTLDWLGDRALAHKIIQA